MYVVVCDLFDFLVEFVSIGVWDMGFLFLYGCGDEFYCGLFVFDLCELVNFVYCFGYFSDLMVKICNFW